ncbi:MAG: hypothetical protein J6C93_03125 [Clostridia bacterium]|nr:hypothetical protein [Clostridia bacterium]
MLVKDVMESAAYALGREDLVAQLHSCTGTPSGDLATLLRCYCLIENEIALDYFPLFREDVFHVEEGKILFSAFPFAPVEILRVADERGEISFSIYPQYLSVCGKSVTVSYTYAPEEKGIDDECTLSPRVSKRLLSYAIASEFCLSVGQFSEAATWENKYREAVRAANVSRKKRKMRSRRWV